jgi:pimeloyl-ACP methyl ester carboxylesterase
MTLLGAEHGHLEVEPHLPEERRSDRDVILLMHGTGGNKQEWSFPDWRGLNYDDEHRPRDRHSDHRSHPPLNPLPDFSLSDKKDVRCWRSILLALGHTIISYSQDGPDDRIEVALGQLEDLIVPFIRDDVLTGELAGKRVVVIGHSRGGILTRLYLSRHLDEASEWISRVITLCSPHGATNAPHAARRLRDVIEQRLLGGIPVLARILVPPLARLPLIGADVEPTDAQAQLVPGDPLFDELSQPDDTPEIRFDTFGGSSVRLSRVYIWSWDPTSYIPRWDIPSLDDPIPNPVPHFDWTRVAAEIPVISPILESIDPLLDLHPDNEIFEEQRAGRGDICVTLDSAQLQGVAHRSLPIHHGQAFFDEPLFAEVADLLGTPLGEIVTEECTSGYIGNTRTLELHDPSREHPNCQLDEIVFRWPFSLPEEALGSGYDGCAYCMPEEHHPEPDGG